MDKKNRIRHWFNQPTALPILSIGITVVLAVLVFFYLKSLEQTKIREQFDAVTAVQITTVVDALANVEFSLEAVERLYAASESVTREEFSIMSRAFLDQQPYIQALEWIPRVPHHERVALKEAARASGLENFQIMIRTAQGNMEPSPERDIYYPVFYVEPLANNETAVGYDLASSQTRYAALQAAAMCNCAVATAPITLVQERDSQKAFLLLIPVYQQGVDATTMANWETELEGFTLGVYRYSDLFNEIFANVAEKRMNIWIFDDTRKSELLHVIESPNHMIPSDLQTGNVSIEDIYSYYDHTEIRTEEIYFAGRDLTVVFVANEELIAEHSSPQPILAAVIVLLIGGFVASGFWNQARQKTAVEQEVLSRTKQLQKTKNELQESQSRLQLAVKAGKVGVWDLDLKNDNLNWDEMMYALYGLDPETAENGYLRWRNLVHPEDIDLTEQTFQEALMPDGPPFNTEFRIIRPNDQAIRYIRGIASIFRDDKGNATRIIGINWDVTERALAQKESIEAERQRLANVIEGANVGTWEWNIQSGKIIYNQRWAEILGYSLEEISPISTDTWQIFTHPDDLDRANTLLKRHFDGELAYYACETRMRHKNGNWIWVLDRGKVLKWSDEGRPLVMSGTHLDITEQKQNEESLHLFNQAIEHSPVSVMITNSQGAIQYVNPKFTQVTGYSPEETLGQTPRLLKSGKHPKKFYSKMWDILATGKEWQGEFQNRKKNGELYWDRTSIASVKDLNGEISHYVAVLEDISKNKQREIEMVRQERLAAVGQLAAGIAHDFNNVLAVITLYSQMLQNSPNLTEKEIHQLSVMFQQAKHASELTRQILDFSRRSVREPRPLDLKTHLNKILEFVERTIPEHIRIHRAELADGCIVNADPTQLQQVITNLTLNARDAMPEGGDLTFKLSRFTLNSWETAPSASMQPGEWVKLTISDTGSGIPRETQAHIFEPFFTTKEVGKGSGLGLAQVYGIVQQHDGAITVKSRVGKGTKFTIYLPALKEQSSFTSNENIENIPYGRGETILLVEDNKILLEATQDLLQSLNFHVLTAKNGLEAVNMVYLHRGEVELVLSDVVMPKMDGFEMVKTLQEGENPPKVLLMSGFPRDREMSSEVKPYVSGWLQKPLDLHKLAQTLKEALQA